MESDRIKNYKLPIGGLRNIHENQIELICRNNAYFLLCYSDGYAAVHGAGGKFYAGGCEYPLPSDFKITYDNLLDYIRTNTWVEDAIESFISREDFTKQFTELENA